MGKEKSGRPKGRTSAYAYFIQHRRQQLRDQSPGHAVDFKAFSRQCARSWQAMSPAEKAPFLRLARADQRRYEYQMRHSDPKRAAKKDPRAPKRPLSAFMLFAQEYRQQILFDHPELSITQVAQMLRTLWADLSPRDRCTFQSMAAQIYETYARQMAKYHANKGRCGKGVAAGDQAEQEDSSCSSEAEEDDPEEEEADPQQEEDDQEEEEEDGPQEEEDDPQQEEDLEEEEEDLNKEEEYVEEVVKYLEEEEVYLEEEEEDLGNRQEEEDIKDEEEEMDVQEDKHKEGPSSEY